MNRGAYGKGSAEALMRRLSLTLGFYNEGVPEQSYGKSGSALRGL